MSRVSSEGNSSDPRRATNVATTVPYEGLAALRERAKDEVGKVVVGQGHAVELLLVAAMARGHVLLEGPPGTAKTLLGRATAYVLGADFNRVQFTPDTTPTELIGQNVTRAGETKFVKGTVFTNVLLADEINRTPPRTQSALLEAMAERADHDRGSRAPPARPVPRDRDAEPVRAGGRVPAPRVEPRPVPLQDLHRLLLDREGSRDAPAPAHGRHPGHARRDHAAARDRRSRQGPDRARPDARAGGGRAVRRRRRPQDARDRRRHARRQLARRDPLHERDEGARAARRAGDRLDRGRPRDGAVRPDAPPHHRGRGRCGPRTRSRSRWRTPVGF